MNATATTMTRDVYAERVDSGDWPAITTEVNEYGGALLPRLLTPAEAEEIRGLYGSDTAFRSSSSRSRW